MKRCLQINYKQIYKEDQLVQLWVQLQYKIQRFMTKHTDGALVVRV
jgi:hypothetical protein